MRLNKATTIPIKILLTGLFFIAFALKSNGQDKPINRIEFSHGLHQTLKEVNFYDAKTNLLISKFDVYSNNPFQNLDFEIDTLNDANVFNQYVVSAGDFRKFHELFPAIDKPKSEKIYLTSYFDYDYKGNYVPICYQLVISDDAEWFQFISTIFVLDNSGKIVFKLDEVSDCSSPSVTQDGRYLGFVYGTTEGEDGPMSNLSGYKLYDIDRKQLRYHETCEKERESPLGSFFIENKMGFAFSRDSSRYRYLIFDLANGTKYSKIFSADELGKLRGMTDSGFIFLEDSLRQEKKYQEYFDAEKF